MFSPLPIDTFAEVYVFAGEETLHMSARVRSSQRGAGMGVAFTGMSSEDFERLQKIAPSRKEQPKHDPPIPAPLEVPPPQTDARPYTAPQFDSMDLPVTPELFAAVIRVLLRRGVLTRAELLEELERLKAPQE